MRQLATERGLELPTRGGPGAERAGPTDAPVTRVIYRLVGEGTAARPEAVEVKLGISDGTQTEVISGLNEGDRVITSVSVGGVPATAAPSGNPFGGGRRF
jgi:HlyD family secretion protein